MFEIEDEGLANELKTRKIGFEKNGKYCVDVLAAAYITELGKADFQEAVQKISINSALRNVYLVYKDLRKKMYTVNYVENDDAFLVHEKGMIPKNDESKYIVKVADDLWGIEEIIDWVKKASRVRKVFIAARVKNDEITYYKFQKIEM